MTAVNGALALYRDALGYVGAAELEAEVRWQREQQFEGFSESDFLREAAWVILCSGFREAVVRRAFDHISLCFCDWESAEAIVASASVCVLAARAAFDSKAKISAIVRIAELVHERGFEEFRTAVLRDPHAELTKLPFIGPVTVWHLAKNLGMDVAKPDRHLVLAAKAHGYDCVHQFCEVIAEGSGDPVRVVDLVLWRYLADNPSARRRLNRNI